MNIIQSITVTIVAATILSLFPVGWCDVHRARRSEPSPSEAIGAEWWMTKSSMTEKQEKQVLKNWLSIEASGIRFADGPPLLPSWQHGTSANHQSSQPLGLSTIKRLKRNSIIWNLLEMLRFYLNYLGSRKRLIKIR